MTRTLGRVRVLPIPMVAALLLSACGLVAGTPLPTVAPASAGATPTVAPSPSASAPDGDLPPPFPYESLGDPTTVTNPYLPLVPGTYWRWEGVTVEDDEEIPHQIITMVTDMTKMIDGVSTIVGYDEDWADGELVEAEIFFAVQDDDGNVWRLGEYPEEYEGGQMVANPAWVAGADGALAGVMMPAEPARGGQSYAQGWGPGVGWADRGWVIVDGDQDCVPAGCYEDVIVVQEWDIAEPLARQLKFHAPGVGVIRVDWSGSADQSQESLELVEFRQLTDEELADLREKALALEERAHDTLPGLFSDTERMQPI
ncbi:MAG: hypothetical protein K5924_06460 [Chloroflexi bacterium]|nr:hypothetical protein [Chloroflexota bacterium]